MLPQSMARVLSLESMFTSGALSTSRVGGSLLALGVLSAALIAAPAAQAHGSVQWSIGINLPPVGAVVTSRPYHAPPPAVVYAPPPAVVAPVYQAHPAYPAYPIYGPPRVIVAPVHGWAPPPGRGRWKDRDRDGIPDRWERGPHGSQWHHGPGPHGPPPRYGRGW
jgi:hypothetical protein